MRDTIYFRIIKKQPYFLIQFNGISIVDINHILCSLDIKNSEIWIYREIPYYNDVDEFELFSKLKVQHSARKRISIDYTKSSTDCISIGKNNPLSDMKLDDIINENVNIMTKTCFFAWTHDFDWAAHIYINKIELLMKILTYLANSRIKLVFSNDDKNYE